MQQRAIQEEQFSRGFDTFVTGGFRMLDLATRIQAETLRFMGKRMSDYVKAADELRQCRTPADVLSVQANMVLQAMSDYHAEADKLIKGLMTLQKPVQQAMESAIDHYQDSVFNGGEGQDEERSSRRKKN